MIGNQGPEIQAPGVEYTCVNTQSPLGSLGRSSMCQALSRRCVISQPDSTRPNGKTCHFNDRKGKAINVQPHQLPYDHQQLWRLDWAPKQRRQHGLQADCCPPPDGGASPLQLLQFGFLVLPLFALSSDLGENGPPACHINFPT